MIRFIYLLIISFCAQNIWAQNEYFSDFTTLEKILVLQGNYKYESGREMMSDIRYSSFGDNIFYSIFNSQRDDDTIVIYSVNCNTYKSDSFYLRIKGLSKRLYNHYYNTLNFIDVNHKWTVIGVYDSVYIFDEDRKFYGKVYADNYEYCSFIGDDILFISRNYNSNIKGKYNTAFSLLDLNKGVIIKTIFPEFKFIQFTQIEPNHWISAASNKILFSQAIEYNIDIYDNKLEKINNINYQINSWKKIPAKSAKKITNKKLAGIEAINALIPFLDSISRIEQAYFVNDSTILIFRLGGSSKCFFDIWKNRNNKWVIYKSDFIDKYKDGIITKNNYPIFDEKINRNIIITKRNMASFAVYSPVNPIGMDKVTYLNKVNDYAESSHLKLLLFIYSFNFQ